MKIAIPKEMQVDETRVPMLPALAKKLVDMGAEVAVESGLGQSIKVSDQEYKDAGAIVVSDRKELLSTGDIILRLNKPPKEEIAFLKKGSVHVSFLDPFNEDELLDEFTNAGVSAISIEMIPRSTIAQKMDALSSQANLAGYVAVILAASKSNKILPMMTTPSGTISPAHVFVIGAGVAGLQAIATAGRLGARVEAFDTRPVVEEQVKSLGAKFIKIDLGEDAGETEQGYAKQLTPEQLEKQKQGMAKVCTKSDIVITTAQVFGRKAPVILTKDMIKDMKPGSVIIDMAVSTGGNVEGSKIDEEVDINGVNVIGLKNFPGRVAYHASQMYASNLVNFINHFWNKETKVMELNLEDEIVQNSLVVHNGEKKFKK